MADERAINWVRETFKDDIITQREKGELVEYIQTFPFLEYMGLNLLVEYYTDVKDVAKAPQGTGFRGTTKLTDFAETYQEAILGDSLPSVVEKIRRMIELDETAEDRTRKDNFYLKYWLDRLTNPQFVDYRGRFHRLDKEYRDGSDHEAGLKRLYREYKSFRILIDLKNAKQTLTDGPAKRYRWDAMMKKMVAVEEAESESAAESEKEVPNGANTGK